jgi:hypothetical protein
LNLGLGLETEAIDAAQSFNNNFGRRKPEQAAQIAFAIAAHYAEKKDWQQVKQKLAGTAMSLIDRQATLDVKVQAHALLAQAYVQMKTGSAAKTEYGKVVGAWADPQKAAAEIQAGPDDPATKQRRMGRALTAVGEAVFYFAEEKREAVNRVKFPEYKGTGEKDTVLKHINTKVKDWISKKKPLVEAATSEYKKIVDLEPLPPPKWVIAGGARVGDMWATFVKEFRAAPIPKSMSEDYELRTAYFGALDEASEPLKLIGKGAFKTCLEYSVTYQYFDEFSRACEEWLAEEYKAEFHLVDEFRGAPNRVNSVLKEKPYPLKANGEPMLIAIDNTPAPAAKKEPAKAQK